MTVAEATITTTTPDLGQLQRDGFVHVSGALTPDETERIRQRINHAREMKWEEGLNDVGNMWFDSLLDREPETFGPLVGHPSVRPWLEGMMGRQCQLRSLRAHINPGPYLQEWHMDFYGYWIEKREAEKHPLAAPPVGVNTTFYFQDNGPELAHLKFVKGGHLSEPPFLAPETVERWREWCEEQEHVVVYPKAGDVVVFLSHIPHQGAKFVDTLERSNVVCHYQRTSMHPDAWHVSRVRGWDGTFPFTGTGRIGY